MSELNMLELNEIIKGVTIRHGDDIRSAAVHVAAVSSSLGLRPAATIDISSRDDMYDDNGASLHKEVFGWSEVKDPWWDRPQLALKSPVALACRFESEPFWCNARGAKGCAKNTDLDGISFRRFFETTPQINALLMVPVRLTFGRIGAASFSPMDENISDLSDVYAEHSAVLAAIMNRFLATYAACTGGAPPASSEIKLGRREVQCLHWASQGKTDYETAIILGVSHAAVQYHVSHVVEKLDCVNRAQAIFKAGQLGYLTSN